jgi:peptidoglycan biosynthesis protein MviN/MurJ (putative lipid II flippase)
MPAPVRRPASAEGDTWHYAGRTSIPILATTLEESAMPAHAIAPLTPYLSVAAIAFIYYRRIRRSFGRQPWHPVRAGLRLGLLVLVSALLAFAAYGLPGVAPGIALGALAGAALGVFSLRHTRAEWTDGHGWYTPNAWIGAGLMVLLLARLAWRWADGGFGAGVSTAGTQASPLTMGIAATLVVYALVHVGGLWWRMRQLRLQAGVSQATVSMP